MIGLESVRKEQNVESEMVSGKVFRSGPKTWPNHTIYTSLLQFHSNVELPYPKRKLTAASDRFQTLCGRSRGFALPEKMLNLNTAIACRKVRQRNPNTWTHHIFPATRKQYKAMMLLKVHRIWDGEPEGKWNKIAVSTALFQYLFEH